MQTDLIVSSAQAARLGERIYEDNLKSELEPAHNGRVVAIYLPSQTFFVGDSLLDASDSLRVKHPDVARGEVYARRIGNQALIRVNSPRLTNR